MTQSAVQILLKYKIYIKPISGLRVIIIFKSPDFPESADSFLDFDPGIPGIIFNGLSLNMTQATFNLFA